MAVELRSGARPRFHVWVMPAVAEGEAALAQTDLARDGEADAAVEARANVARPAQQQERSAIRPIPCAVLQASQVALFAERLATEAAAAFLRKVRIDSTPASVEMIRRLGDENYLEHHVDEELSPIAGCAV
jgi:hypothetical protein